MSFSCIFFPAVTTPTRGSSFDGYCKGSEVEKRDSYGVYWTKFLGWLAFVGGQQRPLSTNYLGLKGAPGATTGRTATGPISRPAIFHSHRPTDPSAPLSAPSPLAGAPAVRPGAARQASALLLGHLASLGRALGARPVSRRATTRGSGA